MKVWGDLQKLSDGDCVSTVKKCSYDESNKVYLIDSNKVAIDFDIVSEKLTSTLGVSKPRSMDCLYVEDSELVLVEFKNKRRIEGKLKEDIKLKIYASLALLKYCYQLGKDEIAEIIIVKKGGISVQTSVEIGLHFDKMANSSCPTWLKFIEKTHGIKISMMNQDDYLKRLI